MADAITVAQQSQWGVETTHGTLVAANKLLESISVIPQVEAEFEDFQKQGRRFMSESAMAYEWATAKLEGKPSYSELVYPFSGLWGGVSPAAHGSTGKDWTWTPPLTGVVDPKTFSWEQGDANFARRLAYGTMNGLTLKFTKKDASLSGDAFGAAIDDGGAVTMTSSPTAVGHVAILGKHVAVYVDTTSGGLGGTKLLRLFSAEFAYTETYGPVFTMDPAQASFTVHADRVPKVSLKLRVEADAQSRSLHADMQVGNVKYIRLKAVGAQIESGVNYTLQIDGAWSVRKPSAPQDQDGVYAYDWEFVPVEDTTWGKALTVLLTNTVASL